MLSFCAKTTAVSTLDFTLFKSASIQRSLDPIKHNLKNTHRLLILPSANSHSSSRLSQNQSTQNSQVTIQSSEQRLKPPPLSDNDNQPEREKLPNEDELYIIKEHMIQYIPYFFTMSHQYRIYRKDIIFENNLYTPPKTTIGISRYAAEVAKLRMYAHCKYANVKASVISADSCLINGSVRVHWKVAGISQKSAFMFWNFMPWNYRKAMNDQSLSMEGISTFYINGGDGVIIKHRIDNVILDEDTTTKDSIRHKANKLGFT